MNAEFYAQDNLVVDNLAKSHLAEAAKWGRFLAIVGFVIIGLIVIVAFGIITMGPSVSRAFEAAGQPIDFPIGALGIAYLVAGGIYLYPTMKLFNFSKNAKAALLSNNPNLLTESLGNLKSLFKFFGIITAIVLGLYALVLVFALALGAGGVLGR